MLRAEPPSPRRFHVLLVVTDEETESRIRSQLSHSYYRITPHRTFKSAVNFFEKELFDVDLVLSSLEVEDGYNFIAQIQLMRKNIPHVVIFGAERFVHHEVIRAYKLGACYILWKPVSEKSDEIENLWKHAFRWRAQNEDLWQRVFRLRVQKEGSSSQVPSQQESLKRGYEFVNHGEEPPLSKRMVWDEKLDSLFVEVVNDLGEKNAGPKRILEEMNQREPQLFLTREQVGSHLQKHREKEKKTKLPQRMNNANGRNVMTVNRIPPRFDMKNHVLARPLVSSSSRRDMWHLHLPETSTTNSLLPPPPLPEMERHHYNQQHIVCQPQIQNEYHEQHLAGQPMQLNNSGAVTSLNGNGSNNLISESQPGMERNMLPQGTPFGRSNMEQLGQNHSPGTSFENSNMEQLGQNHSPGTSFENSNMEQLGQNHSLGTSFENNNMEQQLITQNLTSSTQQPDQTSYDLFAPIRSGHDRMITLEATGVDEFADHFNQQLEVDVQSSDVGDIFPIHGGFLDAFQDIQHPFQEMDEMVRAITASKSINDSFL